MKKHSLFLKILFLSFFGILIFSNISAQEISAPERELEVTYPSVIGEPPTTVATPPEQYVVYIFNFAIWGSGFVALLVIVIAGFRYLSSAGNPQTMQDSKNQITAALSGLLILLSIWLILNTINPNLTNFELSPLPYSISGLNPGVWLCKENVPFKEVWNKTQNPPKNVDKKFKEDVEKAIKQIRQECLLVVSKGKLDNNFNDKVKYIFLASSKAVQYGAFLYEGSKFDDKATAYYSIIRRGEVVSWSIPNTLKVSSVKPFILKYGGGSSSYIELYERISFNRDDDTAHKAQLRLDENDATSPSIRLREDLAFPKPKGGSLPEIGSIKIEGPLIAIFFRDAEGRWTQETEIDVYTESDSDLNNNLLERWRNDCKESRKLWFGRRYPCAAKIVIVNGAIY